MWNFCKLVRWPNLVFLAILLWVMEKWVAVPVLNLYQWGEVLSWWMIWLLILAVICIAAGGYVINDYFDVKIDRINRPDHLIVTNTVSKQSAMHYFYILTGVGIISGLVLSYFVHSLTLAMIFVLIPGLLWFYSSSYKRLFLLGNIIVALSSAMAPMIVAITNVGLLKYLYGDILQYTSLVHDLYVWIGGFAAFAFLCTWIREIIKDLQDNIGDRELECHTMPIVIGETWTRICVTVMILGTCALIAWITFCCLPFPHQWKAMSTRFAMFGLIIPLVCDICLLWSAKIPSDYRSAQLLMKLVMFLGVMSAFVIHQQL